MEVGDFRHKKEGPALTWAYNSKRSSLPSELKRIQMCLQANELPDTKPDNMTTMKKQQVIVIGVSLLQGTEAPTCQPDLSSTGLLPAGAQTQGVLEGLPKLVCPPVFFYVCTIDTARGNLDRMKNDFRAQGEGK